MAVLFACIKVSDPDAFKVVHTKALAAQRQFGLTERVWQSVDEPGALVVTIEGSRESIEAWRNSVERASLAAELRIESTDCAWLTEEMTFESERGPGS